MSPNPGTLSDSRSLLPQAWEPPNPATGPLLATLPAPPLIVSCTKPVSARLSHLSHALDIMRDAQRRVPLIARRPAGAAHNSLEPHILLHNTSSPGQGQAVTVQLVLVVSP